MPDYIDGLPVDPTSGNGYAYAALRSAPGGPATPCASYHLGARLENQGSYFAKALNTDNDFTPVGSNVCTSGGWAGNADIAATLSDFAGTDPIYDIKP
ncbi:hypothetical protein FJY94_00815 [Candidatus Kaiserbacteria bacterium]|nr:hypothetical protein [Candidatus Kaiserbacteria bacterium]